MRPWAIQEQQFNVDEIGFTFQFSSVHSEAVAAGEAAPDHDQSICLRMWNRERTKCLTAWFDRGGLFVRAELDSGEEMQQPAQPEHTPWPGAEGQEPGLLDGTPGF